MISHVFIGVTDFAPAFGSYAAPASAIWTATSRASDATSNRH